MLQLRPQDDQLNEYQPHDVVLDGESTIKEVVDEILKKGMWGVIIIENSNGEHTTLLYDKDHCHIPQDLIGSNFISVEAFGGWGVMDYKITI